MKKSFLILFLFLSYTSLFSQDLKPSESHALMTLYVSNSQNQAIVEEVTFTHASTSEEYKGMLNEKGILEILLPINAGYYISFEKAPQYDRFKIGNFTNYSLKKRVIFEGSNSGKLFPSLENALINFKFLDLKNKPLEDEPFTITSLSNGKSYSSSTDKDGTTQLVIPIGDRYSMSVNYDSAYRFVQLKSKPDLYTYNITYRSIGTKAWKERIAEKKKRLEEREKAWKAGAWSLPQMDTVVQTVLKRNSDWKNMLIVADVTGSMYPYMEQVMNWWKLNFQRKEEMQIVFFNDGDDKTTDQKEIGKTGGIYFCKYCSIEDFNNTLKKAMKAGNGGDGPENDLEGIIKGIQQADAFSELVLIADNYSDVRDISLLSRIKHPIKVILCGGDIDTNEEYLNIAYQTKGSVHHMNGDLINLASITEGSEIKIKGHTYILNNGKFYFVRD